MRTTRAPEMTAESAALTVHIPADARGVYRPADVLLDCGQPVIDCRRCARVRRRQGCGAPRQTSERRRSKYIYRRRLRRRHYYVRLLCVYTVIAAYTR